MAESSLMRTGEIASVGPEGPWHGGARPDGLDRFGQRCARWTGLPARGATRSDARAARMARSRASSKGRAPILVIATSTATPITSVPASAQQPAAIRRDRSIRRSTTTKATRSRARRSPTIRSLDTTLQEPDDPGARLVEDGPGERIERDGRCQGATSADVERDVPAIRSRAPRLERVASARADATGPRATRESLCYQLAALHAR